MEALMNKKMNIIKKKGKN